MQTAPTFTDSMGRPWNLRIDFESITRLRQSELSIDLLDMADETADGSARKSATLTRLAHDEIYLVAVIYELLKPEITSRGLTESEFVRGLLGEGLESALDALIEGIANFSRPQRGAMLRKIWSKLKSSESLMNNRACELLESPDLTEAMTRSVDSRMNALLWTLNESSGNLPAKPESLPGNSPCVN